MQDGLEADLSNFSLGQPESRGESTCTQNEPACPPFTVSFKLKMKKEQTHSIHSIHTQRKDTIKEKEEEGRPKCSDQTDSSEQVVHLSFTRSTLSKGCDYAGSVTKLCAQV